MGLHNPLQLLVAHVIASTLAVFFVEVNTCQDEIFGLPKGLLQFSFI